MGCKWISAFSVNFMYYRGTLQYHSRHYGLQSNLSSNTWSTSSPLFFFSTDIGVVMFFLACPNSSPFLTRRKTPAHRYHCQQVSPIQRLLWDPQCQEAPRWGVACHLCTVGQAALPHCMCSVASAALVLFNASLYAGCWKGEATSTTPALLPAARLIRGSQAAKAHHRLCRDGGSHGRPWPQAVPGWCQEQCLTIPGKYCAMCWFDFHLKHVITEALPL